jgi:hypothetical protein
MLELKKIFNETFNTTPVTSLLFYQSCRDGDLDAVKEVIFQFDLDKANVRQVFSTVYTGIMTFGRVSTALDEVIYSRRENILRWLVLESGIEDHALFNR